MTMQKKVNSRVNLDLDLDTHSKKYCMQNTVPNNNMKIFDLHITNIRFLSYLQKLSHQHGGTI